MDNEITVEVTVDYKLLDKILKDKGFKISEEYNVDDIYMINKDIQGNPLDLLKQCVLIRHIYSNEFDYKKLTYKNKVYDKDENIISQGKIQCNIDSIENTKNIFECVNFKELITIKDHLIVYYDNFVELAVQLVNNKHIYIEFESECKRINKNYDNIEDMINILDSYNLPYKKDNYFVKKAKVEIIEKKQ